MRRIPLSPDWPRLAALLSLAALSGGGVVAQEQPLDVDQTEEVQVRLVILDTVVVDGKGRTVPGLGLEDFEVLVDGRPRPIDTLDVDCPGGALEAPHGVQNPAKREAVVAPRGGRRIVLAVDYLHGTPTTDVLERAKRMVRAMDGDGEEIMVVALTGGLRVEQRFTSDRQQVWNTLQRMEYDISLWNGRFPNANELGFFNGLLALVDLLEQVPGSKAVVLFSTADIPTDLYDTLYARVAGSAVASRSAVYTVQANGLQPPDMGTTSLDGRMRFTPIGGSRVLRRLAQDTGGTYTRGTNDLSLGYARAQRDLACRYAVGFYDDNVELDKTRQVEVRVKRPGLRAIHPSNYVFRSPEVRRETRLCSAFIAPEMFEDGVVRTHVFPVRPRKPRRWDTVVAVSFPVPVGGGHGEQSTQEFGAVIRRGNEVVHQFSWKVTLRAADTDEARPMVTFLEPLELKSGVYRLSAVVSGADDAGPSASVTEFEIPRVEGRALLVEPILWRRSSGGVVLSSGDVPQSEDRLRNTGMGAHLEDYEPLLVQRGRPDESLHVMTQYCRAGSRAPAAGAALVRDLSRDDGVAVGTLAPVPLRLEDPGKVRCQGLWDELPAAALAPGDYRFEVRVEPSEDLARRLKFAVDAPDEGP